MAAKRDPGVHPEDVWILDNATASGGPPTWISLNADGGPPPGRQQAAAAYDAATNRFILHGGCSGDCDFALSDTWVLTNANGQGGTSEWTRIPDAPVARTGAASAYDTATNRLIVFGGSEGASGSDLNDVWVLKEANGIGTPEWEELAPEGSMPPPRSNGSAGYDSSANRFIVFGGRQADDTTLNDTWSLSGANGLAGTSEWTELVPAGTPPGARWGHTGIYDEGAGRLVIFGGTSIGFDDDLNFVANDLWMLTDAAGGTSEWIQLAPDHGPPLGRLLGAAAYSAAENRMLVVSGKNNRAAVPSDLVDDHWILTKAVGSLPHVSAGQPDTTFDTTTPAVSDTYFWRVVSHDTRGARAGSPVFRFRPNAVPTVDAGSDQTIFLPGSGDGIANLTGSASDDDLPLGRILAFEWTLESGPGDIVIDSPNSTATTVTIRDEGTYLLRLTASDSELEGFDEVVLTFIRNKAPLVDVGADRVIELPSDTTFLDGTITDDGLPEGELLDIQWTQVEGPGTVTFSDAQSEDTDATFDATGIYVLRLTVGDSEFAVSDDVQVAFTVQNRPPTVDAGPDRIVTPNLIANPGAEDELVNGEIPHWTEVSGSNWTRRVNNDPFEGEAHFYAGNSPGAVELAQDVDVSALADAVDGGAQRFQFLGYIRTFQPDTARIIFEYRDAGNSSVFDAFDSGPLSSHQEWIGVSDGRLAPPRLHDPHWYRTRRRTSLQEHPRYRLDPAKRPRKRPSFRRRRAPKPRPSFRRAETTFLSSPRTIRNSR